jgi:membrane protease YdiL (CAAX protease family)
MSQDAEEAAPAWPLWTIPVALVSAVVLGSVGQGLVLVIAGVSISAKHPPAGVTVGGTLVLDFALVGSALVFAQLTAPLRPWQFGLRLAPLGRALKWLGIVAASYVAVGQIYGALVSRAPKDQLQGLTVTSPAASIAAFAVLVCLVAPVAEELFFRGFVFGALRRRVGVWAGAVISGVLFGAVHAGGGTPAVFLPLLALFGFGLAILYWRTGSLLPGIALHSINNAIAFGALINWGWQIVVLVAAALLVLALVLVPVAAAAERFPPVASEH